jgi:hypothetical protein
MTAQKIVSLKREILENTLKGLLKNFTMEHLDFPLLLNQNDGNEN